MPLEIPSGSSVVDVFIISPNQVLDVPASEFLTPDIPGTTYKDTPCLCFLVEHTDISGKRSRALFDLGIRPDWERLPPAVVSAIQSMNIQIRTEADVADQLATHGLDLSTINTIFFSHMHFDHVGDATRLPSVSRIVVGPGVSDHCLPGYPENSNSPLCSDAFHDRDVHELDFSEGTINIAGLRALDWFGDGSFYILDTPGHATGHISALARTQLGNPMRNVVDTFMLLAGDVCHHMGAIRPNQWQHLPNNLSIRSKTSDKITFASSYRRIHPRQCMDQPFYTPASGAFNSDPLLMQDTLEKIAILDNDPRVFTVLSHDNWLMDVVALFPERANDWHAKGWSERSSWRFLQDFQV